MIGSRERTNRWRIHINFLQTRTVERPDDFNCLFCYCPLYTLGDQCGGNFKYRENGIKDCTDCVLPHRPESYEYIIGKYSKILELAKRRWTSGKEKDEK